MTSFGMGCLGIGRWMVFMARSPWHSWNVMEEEFHRDKMLARQKTIGKMEVLNLKCSINYGDVSAPSRRWKGKAHMT
jgi:hypothetical protein